MQVPDAASTGTNVFGALALLDAMRAEGKRGTIVTLICDPGERYLDTYYDPDWVVAQGLDPAPFSARLERFSAVG